METKTEVTCQKSAVEFMLYLLNSSKAMVRKKTSSYIGRLLSQERQFSQVKVPCLTIVTIIQDCSLEVKLLKIINTLFM